MYCGDLISCSARNGTNAMKRHTLRCKKTPFFLDKKQTLLNFESSTKVNTDGTIETVHIPKYWRFNQDELRKEVAKMVIVDELPFSFVEGEGFRSFCKKGIPDFSVPSRSTVTRDCYALYIEKRKQLKDFFAKMSSRVCLTTDCWTSGQNLSYVCLTAHFIDDNWKLHKKIINFCPVGGHSGELIGRTVEKCLLDWGLKRILTVTVDNASSNDLAIVYLRNIFNLWDGSVLNSEFLHMRCAAHILNLVVKDGLKDVDASVTKVRNAVKYVRSSPARLQKFKSCVEEENIESKSLVTLDIETRWNSTYLMLKSALVFRKAFKNLKTKYTPFTKDLKKVGGPPEDGDWDKVETFLPFLQVFYEATLQLSGSRYVTGNTLVQDIYDIGYEISSYLDHENVGLKNMAQQMKLKFDKYWLSAEDVNVLMFIACVLDPRHKLNYVEWIVRRSYAFKGAYVLNQRIRDALNSLFVAYSSSQDSHVPSKQMGSASFGQTSTQDGGGRGGKKSRLRDDYLKEGNLSISEAKSELEKYLEDKPEPDNDTFEILDWWAAQTKSYPILMKMARDILAIPVSTVASESAFSTGGRILDSFRTSLTPRMVEALVCAQDWLRTSQPTIIEESLLELEKMEKDMAELTMEQPTIEIDETTALTDI